MQPDQIALVAARDLGARGSRTEVSGADPTACPSPAARAVLAAVPLWWAHRAQAVGLSGRWTNVYDALDLPPHPWTDDVDPGLPDGLERWGPHELGAAYVAALDSAVRSRHGRHYTPELLATELWAMTRRTLGRRKPQAEPLPGLVRDPASGAGSLLIPAVREHLTASLVRRAEPRVVLAGLPHVIEAIDTDPAAVWLANVILAAEALPILAKVPERQRRPLPQLARVGDGLDPDLAPARAVLMNPPYGRVRLAPEDRARFASTLYGHANLYGLFLAAALESLDPTEGVLAALVPTSFTSGLYFRNLRAELSRTAALRSAAFVSDRGGVFAGVLQETCLAVFSRRRSRRTDITAINGEARSSVARVPTPRGSGPWLLPRHSGDAPAAAAASLMPLTLGEAGWSASTGPLVWNRRRADLHDESGPDRAPIVWAADLDGGKLHQDAARDNFRYFSLSKPSDRQVMVLSEPCVLVQRTTSPEQRRRLVAIELDQTSLDAMGGRVVVENHVNVLRPRPAMASVVGRRLLAHLLASPTLDRIMRCMSGSVAVSAFELESLPLPGLETLTEWDKLASQDPDALDDAIARAYQPRPA